MPEDIKIMKTFNALSALLYLADKNFNEIRQLIHEDHDDGLIKEFLEIQLDINSLDLYLHWKYHEDIHLDFYSRKIVEELYDISKIAGYSIIRELEETIERTSDAREKYSTERYKETFPEWSSSDYPFEPFLAIALAHPELEQEAFKNMKPELRNKYSIVK